MVSAAASLTDVMTEIGKAYSKANPGAMVRFNFGASGALQHQIEQGAPVDVFVSASAREMDSLQRSGSIDPATRCNVAGNELALIVPAGSKLTGWDGLKSSSVRRIAIADPNSVPAGRYAKETLSRRGLWDLLKAKYVFAENVRQSLTYVSTSDADAGLVFVTDARKAKARVRVVSEASDRDHSPIIYPAAVIKGNSRPAVAQRFVQFLNGPQARAILGRWGFKPAPR